MSLKHNPDYALVQPLTKNGGGPHLGRFTLNPAEELKKIVEANA
jgi:hypothetical protein